MPGRSGRTHTRIGAPDAPDAGQLCEAGFKVPARGSEQEVCLVVQSVYSLHQEEGGYKIGFRIVEDAPGNRPEHMLRYIESTGS